MLGNYRVPHLHCMLTQLTLASIGPLLNGRLSEIIGIVVFIMTVISQLFKKVRREDVL